VTGQGLLNLTVDDLYKLHVEKLGHQEIIMESLDLLRNFHFHLDQVHTHLPTRTDISNL
jgi:connector enhancer of kinase suppressor of Ras 2